MNMDIDMPPTTNPVDVDDSDTDEDAENIEKEIVDALEALYINSQ